MALKVEQLTLGPLQNNVYLLGDQESGDAVVIDPSFEGHMVLDQAKQLGWKLRQVWLTHAHYDHIAGVGQIANAFDPSLPVGLHPADQEWYQGAGALRLGLQMTIQQPPTPSIHFEDGMSLGLRIDNEPAVKVLHAPGHSPGHVMFYCEALGILFCGDVIFRQGIGRTDLEGGDFETLLTSIHEKVLSLPNEVRLLPGHGPESTVGYERMHNPFLRRFRIE